MESELRRDFLRQTYNILGRLYESLSNVPSPYLGHEQLNKLHISTSPIDVHSDDAIDFEARFFQPMSGHELNRRIDTWYRKVPDDLPSSESGLGYGWPRWYPQEYWWPMDRHETGGRLMDYLLGCLERYEGHLMYEPGWECGSMDDPVTRLRQRKGQGSAEGWSTQEFLHPRRECGSRDQGPVHACCLLSDGHENDDGRILRSEMLAAVTLIRDQMRQRKHWDNYQFPVLLYSFSGYSVRILQVHYDHIRGVLAVRVTPYVRIAGMSDEDKRNTVFVLRYLLSTPVGKTTFESLELEDEQNQNSAQPRTPSKRSLKCSG